METACLSPFAFLPGRWDGWQLLTFRGRVRQQVVGGPGRAGGGRRMAGLTPASRKDQATKRTHCLVLREGPSSGGSPLFPWPARVT